MASKSGYINIDENEEITIEEPKLSNSVSVSEQEVCINFMRDEDFATIYTSDTTYMTKLDKLCKTSSDMYSLIADTGRGKHIVLKIKHLSVSERRKENYLKNRKLLQVNE